MVITHLAKRVNKVRGSLSVHFQYLLRFNLYKKYKTPVPRPADFLICRKSIRQRHFFDLEAGEEETSKWYRNPRRQGEFVLVLLSPSICKMLILKLHSPHQRFVEPGNTLRILPRPTMWLHNKVTKKPKQLHCRDHRVWKSLVDSSNSTGRQEGQLRNQRRKPAIA